MKKRSKKNELSTTLETSLQMEENQVIRNLKESSEKIKKGLSNPYAGTGRPIDELYGGAKINAIVSNIGGGSKENGGDGMNGGLETLMNFSRDFGRKEEINKSKQIKKKH